MKEPEKPAAKAPAAATEKPAAKARRIDETIPGGRYIVDGVEVDAEGEPIE